MNPKKLKFTCPRCGKHRIEEVMDNVQVTAEVKGLIVDDGLANCEYGKSLCEAGEVVRYQCMDCGYIPLDETKATPEISDLTELAKWIEFQQVQAASLFKKKHGS